MIKYVVYERSLCVYSNFSFIIGFDIKPCGCTFFLIHCFFPKDVHKLIQYYHDRCHINHLSLLIFTYHLLYQIQASQSARFFYSYFLFIYYSSISSLAVEIISIGLALSVSSIFEQIVSALLLSYCSLFLIFSCERDCTMRVIYRHVFILFLSKIQIIDEAASQSSSPLMIPFCSSAVKSSNTLFARLPSLCHCQRQVLAFKPFFLKLKAVSFIFLLIIFNFINQCGNCHMKNSLRGGNIID